ncbi:MAG: phenylalanyl-tRNA synthetase alpha chain, partial [Baekduia sp.]|nr:phenylalanyl-tRNA synthetase alpha chain [Baekduia sp.]
MLERIEEIHDEGLTAIDAAGSTDALEELRVRLLGRKAELPNLLRGVGELPPEQRGQVGKRANEVRKALEARLAAANERLDAAELDSRLIADRVDVTLPGDPLQPVGRLHLITQTLRELEDVFVGLGFTVVEGNEVETVHYNFD